MKQAIFAGRLGQDAELRYTPDGTPVCGFSLAVEGRKRTEEPTWVSCNIWRERAEKIQPHLKKGGFVTVTGEVHVRTWKDREGQLHAGMVVDVQELTFGGSPQRQEPTGQERASGDYLTDQQIAADRRRQQAQKSQPQTEAPFDDDIPF